MSILCRLCGKVKDNGRMVIHGSIGPFTMVCDECYADSEDYMEEMRGCGCGNHDGGSC
jgi:hypothetical protein